MASANAGGNVSAVDSQASQTQLQAANINQQTATMNQQAAQSQMTNIQNETMNITQDTMNTSQDAITSSQNSMTASTESSTAATNQSSSLQIQQGGALVDSGGTKIAASAGGGGTSPDLTGGNKGFNWGSAISFVPSLFNLFADGGDIRPSAFFKTGGSISVPSSARFASGGKNVKKGIQSATITGGGQIKGAGSGTSDSILAYLAEQGKFIGVSNGEYIMNAKATRKYQGILQMMNMDKYATGGSIAPEPYVPTLKNPSIASDIAKQDANRQNSNAKMEGLLGQQNTILQGIAKDNGKKDGGGQMVVLNTRASKEEVFQALASDPRALQKILGNNRRNGFR